MKRTGFFAHLARAASVPLALAVGRALPAAQNVGGVMVQAEARIGSFEIAADRVAHISGELSPSGAANLAERGFTSYVEHYGNGATSLIRSLASRSIP